MTEIFNRSTTFLSNDSHSTTRPNHFYIVNASSEDPYKEVSTCLEEMPAGSIIFILTVGLSLRWVIKRKNRAKKPPDAVSLQSIPAGVLRNCDNGLRRTSRHSILSRHVSFVQTIEISPTMNEQRETVDQRNVGNDVVIEMETSSRSSVGTMTLSIGTVNIPFANNSGLTETTEIANLSGKIIDVQG
uniref:Uncharacterized protein n=1 Tax=Acrobeloides nanus TaxID=290746 RepID=A0A914E8W7_9BILA